MDHPIKQTSRERILRYLTLLWLKTRNAAHTIFDFKRETPERAREIHLLNELERALATLRAARTAFSEARDPDLIEALIYEMKTAEARYCFLLKKAKENGLTQERSAR
ncbi:MAG: DUF2508 family protein [Oscillospiraceae bacterium]|nr:DUF2508 family protein [Oscillospiraceae bacterium]